MRIILACTVAAFCLIAGYGWSNGAEAGDLEKGKALYQEKCMICHGPKGDGKGLGAIALNPKPADYTKEKFWEQPKIEKIIAETIVNGKGQMRPSPDLKPEDIQAIILYIKTTFKPK